MTTIFDVHTLVTTHAYSKLSNFDDFHQNLPFPFCFSLISISRATRICRLFCSHRLLYFSSICSWPLPSILSVWICTSSHLVPVPRCAQWPHAAIPFNVLLKAKSTGSLLLFQLLSNRKSPSNQLASSLSLSLIFRVSLTLSLSPHRWHRTVHTQFSSKWAFVFIMPCTKN